MKNSQEFVTFLNLGFNELSISVFDKDNYEVYQDKLLKEKDISNNFNKSILNNFLDKNIFKIEKLTKIFLKKINLVLESDYFISIKVSIKRKSFGNIITDHELRQMLYELREQIKENNPNKSIIHMIIENYVINDEKFEDLKFELKCDNLILELNFICLPNEFVENLNNQLKYYQVELDRIISAEYARKFILHDLSSLNEKALKIRNGENPNEIQIIPKNLSKKGFFEKFFNLFS
tara:strand:+ start:686 stop:1390 length:705 start_codon:yes stop_codon:yes gene_type:complete